MASSRVPALGPRGEGWVVLQLVAVLAIAGCGVAGPGWPDPVAGPLLAVGAAVGAAGALLFAAGLVALGRSLTPLPRPRAGAVLREGDVYARVRHPVYGGILLLAAGWSLASSPLALVPTAALVAVFDLKARREEAWLAERHPEYGAYRAGTPRRFVPWIF